MSLLTLPQAKLSELSLRQRLSHYQQNYLWEEGKLELTVSEPPSSLNCILQLQWKGTHFTLYCFGNDLANWLTADLLGAPFFTLPKELQLALLERQTVFLPKLVCNDIATASLSVTQPLLSLRLSRDNAHISFWLTSAEALFALLPARPNSERIPLPILISLRWHKVYLTLDEVDSLRLGDVLLAPEGSGPNSPLLAYVGENPWGYFQLQSNKLEFIGMSHESDELNPEPLTDLNQLPVQVSFEVGRQILDWHTLTSLEPGSLIDLTTPVDGEVRLLANGRLLGHGRLVEIQGRLGVRIERLTEVTIS